MNKHKEWEIQLKPTTLLPDGLLVAQERQAGQVDASPHWMRVIEYSAYREAIEALQAIALSNSHYSTAQCDVAIDCLVKLGEQDD